MQNTKKLNKIICHTMDITNVNMNVTKYTISHLHLEAIAVVTVDIKSKEMSLLVNKSLLD